MQELFNSEMIYSTLQSIIQQYETEMKSDNWNPQLEMQINYQK